MTQTFNQLNTNPNSLVFDQMKNCVLEDSIKKTLFYLFCKWAEFTQKTRKHNGRSASFVQSSLGSFSEYPRQSDTLTQQYPLHFLFYHCLLLSGHRHLLSKSAHCRLCFKTQCFSFEAGFFFPPKPLLPCIFRTSNTWISHSLHLL